ncbi:hypothetical protein COU13_01325 [Candidatus Kaiserbacteria bacterium CG10_big_fil_rev_8_21_14_0_10_43_70]|uniref:Uncharacterized protein n=1 Tax=Candidatus Kaiserbacteria bacterium CG10_big_fil_rev_8_21_14_0_10_43_70 TaxID=1974605 RepID=A0A2H0UKS9_9BACT|nr:MAG: hypothetical protein COU13_01325 [Candidatus Kaiserbacteria bacterium CG10_big_fil_rev_8_21_14_0_10_43_70]
MKKLKGAPLGRLLLFQNKARSMSGLGRCEMPKLRAKDEIISEEEATEESRHLASTFILFSLLQ